MSQVNAECLTVFTVISTVASILFLPVVTYHLWFLYQSWPESFEANPRTTIFQASAMTTIIAFAMYIWFELAIGWNVLRKEQRARAEAKKGE